MALHLPAVSDLEAATYPDAVLAEVRSMTLTDSLLSRRAVTGITIDPPHSLDLDDAINVRALPEGGWKVEVHVADVDVLVKHGSGVDAEALRRVATHYLGNDSWPMLPPKLSHGLLSLHPRVPRPTVTVSVTVDAQGDIKKIDIDRTLLTSDRRFSYDEAAVILKGKPDQSGEFLKECNVLANTLRTRRRAQGALMIFGEGEEMGYPGNGRTSDNTHRLIEEFMVLANQAVARFAIQEKIPVLFRNHRKPVNEKSVREATENFERLTDTVGANIEEERVRIMRLLGRATYGPALQGHFALGLPAYLHFTSPIRRYADIVSHRNVLAYVEGQQLPYDKQSLQALGEYVTEKSLRIKRKESHGDASFMIEMIKNKVQNTKYTGALVDVCRLLNTEMPAYSFRSSRKGHSIFHTATVSVSAGDETRTSEGQGDSRHMAKQRAAMVMLASLELMQIPPEQKEKMDRLASQAQIAADEDCIAEPSKDSTNRLYSRVLQAQGTITEEVKESGPDHAKIFTCTLSVRIGERQFSVHGKANSKKNAKHHASAKLLRLINWAELGEPQKTSVAVNPEWGTLPEGNVIGALNELCQKNRLSAIRYSERKVALERGVIVFEVSANVLKKDGTRMESPYMRGVTKAIARKRAAQELLPGVERYIQEIHRPPDRSGKEKQALTAVGVELHQLCQQSGAGKPHITSVPVPGGFECTITVETAQGILTEHGAGSTQIEAQTMAAEKMHAHFGDDAELLKIDYTQMLMKYLQEKKSENALYSVKNGGSIYACTCQCGDTSVVAEHPREKLARRKAARQLLALLQNSVHEKN